VARLDYIEVMEGPLMKPASEGSLLDPDRWVDEYGEFLFKHALLRLRDPATAEDMVQETLLAAFRSGNSFAGKANAKSWLIGILKHKICDYYRAASRESSFTDLGFYADEESGRFISHGPFEGGWIHELGPVEWPADPGAALDNEVFWKTFHDCASKLPAKIAAVFALREFDGMESKEICSTLGITEKNLWVMLHRARMALRRCLELNWFTK